MQLKNCKKKTAIASFPLIFEETHAVSEGALRISLRVIDNVLTFSESGNANTYETRRRTRAVGRSHRCTLSEARAIHLIRASLWRGFIPCRSQPSGPSFSRDNASLTTDCERGMSHPIRNFLLHFVRDHPRQLKSSTPSSRVHLDAYRSLLLERLLLSVPDLSWLSYCDSLCKYFFFSFFFYAQFRFSRNVMPK